MPNVFANVISPAQGNSLFLFLSLFFFLSFCSFDLLFFLLYFYRGRVARSRVHFLIRQGIRKGGLHIFVRGVTK